MFLHPRQAEAVMRDLEGVADWGFVIDRVNHRDELRCEIVATGHDHAAVAGRVRDAIRAGLRFGADVRTVDVLPEGHATITDNRDWD
jgi:phenylacetate-CoA ligase